MNPIKSITSPIIGVKNIGATNSIMSNIRQTDKVASSSHEIFKIHGADIVSASKIHRVNIVFLV